MVVVESFSHVIVDNVNAGSISSVIANYPHLLLEIEAALRLYHEQYKAECESNLSQDLINSYEAKIANLELTTETKDREIAELQQKITELTALPKHDWKRLMTLLLQSEIGRKAGDSVEIDRSALVGAIFAENISAVESALEQIIENMRSIDIAPTDAEILEIDQGFQACGFAGFTA
jgi:vacuolar-type H+-ATPase subunit I/STV1